MSALKTLIFFAAVLCVNLEFTNGVEKVVHYSNYEPKNSELYVNLETFWSSNTYQGLTTVACPKGPDCQYERNCTVISHMEPRKSCNVILKSVEPHFITEYLEVLPVGSSRAIIFWAVSDDFESINTTYTVVNLNTCESKHFDLGLSLSFMKYSYLFAHSNIVVYRKSFDFIIQTALNSDWNKYRFDNEGNLISRLEPWAKMYNESVFGVYPIANYTNIKSFCYINASSEPDYEWVLSNSNGSKRLMSAKLFPSDADVSTIHGSIRIALTGDKTLVSVGQFDLDGNVKTNMTIDVQLLTYRVAVLNLERGGMILVAGGYKRHKNLNRFDYDGPQIYHIFKISEYGEIVGSIKDVKTNPCGFFSTTLQLYRNYLREFCVAFLCNSSRRFNTDFTEGNQFTELLVKCYSQDDFTDDDDE